MNRRKYLKALVAAGAASAIPARAAVDPIQLHVDLDVVPTRQKEMATNFHTVFKPVISKQPGFVEVKLLKLRSALKGPAPGSANYRLIISFRTEEDRKAWVARDEHQRVWPSIEKTLRGEKFGAVLYDLI
ncbi:MAG: antibiotic biosynthesis monooxygenase family protein [Bryobacteraceae bacterium]